MNRGVGSDYALKVMSDLRKTVVARGYDALGHDYLAWASAYADPARDRMLDEFTARLASGARVVDLGCGPGVPSTRLLADRSDVIGVDISETQLDAARGNVPRASFVHGDLAHASRLLAPRQA
jgi:trans-aconitate methyltransferase